MSKYKVSDLAKELHTTSKRITEVLKNVGVEVKSSISTISDEEKDKLLAHLGVKKAASDDEKNDNKVEVEVKRKTGPTIIRKKEVFLDENNQEIKRNSGGMFNSNDKKTFVQKQDSNSGLRMGLRHEEGKKKSAHFTSNNGLDESQSSSAKKGKSKVEEAPEQQVAGPVLLKKKTKIPQEEIVAEKKVEEAVVSVEPVVEQATQSIVEEKQAKADEVKPENIEEKVEKAAIDEKPTKAEEVNSASETQDRPKINSEKNAQDNRQSSNRSQESRPQQGARNGQFNRFDNSRPQGNRPAQDNRPQGNRPQGSRPQDGRYQGNRPQDGRYQGNRPQDGRPQGNRPQDGRYQGNRPQGTRPQDGRPQDGRFQGNRPQGARPQDGRFQGNRPQGVRPQGNRQDSTSKNTNSKLELTSVTRDEPQRTAEGFDISKQKEVQRSIKKDQKREVTVNKPNANIKAKPAANIGKRDLKGIVKYGNDYDEIVGGFKKQRKGNRKASNEPKYVPPVVNITEISLPEFMSVKELAEMLKKTSAELIKKLMGLGVMATLNSELDFDTAALITDEFGITANKQVVVSYEDILFDDDEDEDEALLVPRDPVVVVMGHVDHGKTSLLDAIRDTNVISGEAGGITQHIGAYKVRVNDRMLCFLDTPGHEAFTAMRARGAQVTDVAILVVAADDGVMPQTIEAINHAKAANTKIVIAINKIDKEGANPERVKTELLEHGVVVSEYGGDVEAVEISAKKRMNIDGLLEIVCLEADILGLKANPNKQAKGTVIEAKLDKGRGPVATMLVQRGTLNEGDTIVTGSTVGRIRAMTNDKGKKIKKAGPSTPVEIIGLPDVPEAGELFYAVEDEKVARQLVDKRKREAREQSLNASSRVSLDDLFKQIQQGEVKDLNIIVKADVQGSVEAVKQSLEKLSNDEVRVKVVHGGVGAISESDITLAQVANAIIIGFNVRPGLNVDELAKQAEVEMKMYRVIYQAIDDIEKAMKGLLAPEFKEVIIGHVEVRQLYKVSGVGTIGGCYVLDGKVTRNSQVRVVRDGIVITEGAIDTLRRFKDDVKEVATGYECGIMLENFNDIKEGDVIEAFVMEEIER